MRHPRSARRLVDSFTLESLEARALLSAAGSDVVWEGHTPVADATFLEITDGEDASPVDEPYQMGHGDGGPDVYLDLNDLGGAWGSAGDDGDDQEPYSEVPMYTSNAKSNPEEMPVRISMNDNDRSPRDPSMPVYVPGVTKVEIDPADDLPLAEYGPELSVDEKGNFLGDNPDAAFATPTIPPVINNPVELPTSTAWLDFGHADKAEGGEVTVALSFVGKSASTFIVKL